MSRSDFRIVDLRAAPEFFDTVAERRWWQRNGRSQAEGEGALRHVAAASDHPFTLVAALDSDIDKDHQDVFVRALTRQ